MLNKIFKIFSKYILRPIILFIKTISEHFLLWKKKKTPEMKFSMPRIKGCSKYNAINNSEAKFPWFYQYLLKQLKELESAWEEYLEKCQMLNQNQYSEYQSKACLLEECLKCFLFLNSSQTFFKIRYFGRHLPLEMGFQD